MAATFTKFGSGGEASPYPSPTLKLPVGYIDAYQATGDGSGGTVALPYTGDTFLGVYSNKVTAYTVNTTTKVVTATIAISTVNDIAILSR